jgi:hypothetical protein
MTLLELADAYYTVARDMEKNAQEQLNVARRMNQYADMLCEQNMREAKPDTPTDEVPK